MTSMSTTVRRPVLADRAPHLVAREALLIAGAVLLVAASAQIVVPLPFTPVPVTGSTFGVLLAAAALGPTRGVAAMTLYLILGIAGVPLFLGANAGLPYALGATGGYLIGFIVAAWVVGQLARRGLDRRPEGTAAAFVLGSLVVYAFGVPWLAFVLGVSLSEAVALGALPFLIGDALKAALAAAVLPLAWSVVGETK